MPIQTDRGASDTNAVALGMAEVMAKIARLGTIDIVPIREVEPSLNAARDVLRFLERERIRSVIVVSPLFAADDPRSSTAPRWAAPALRSGASRSRERKTESWTLSWHGVQDVLEQWLKLRNTTGLLRAAVFVLAGSPGAILTSFSAGDIELQHACRVAIITTAMLSCFRAPPRLEPPHPFCTATSQCSVARRIGTSPSATS